VYVGYRLHGWLGAIAGAVGLILPPFLIMLVATPLYFEVGKLPQLQGFFVGIRPAVVAVIAAASWRLGKKGLKDRAGFLIAAVVMALSLVFGHAQELARYVPAAEAIAPRVRDVGSIGLIVLAGVMGLLLPSPEAPAKGGDA
jgi:chromate transport protein ChrA